MEKVVIEVEAKTGKAIDNIEDVQEAIQDVGKESKKTKTDVSELGGQLDAVSGGAITKFKGLTGTLKGVTKSFGTLRGAIIATGIGALIIAVTSLTTAFTSSEEGQNKFAKALKQLGVIAGNIGDIFSSLGKVLISVFVDRDLKAAGDAFDEFKNRIVNFGEETQKEIALAGELADKIADANKKERELLVERAKINVEINKLKTKAAEVDKFTTEQRIKFLTDAAALEDEITGKEVDLARIRLEIKTQENSLSESTREDLDEEARLTEELIRLEEGRLIRNKELLGVAAGLRKTENDRIAAERKAEIEAFKKQQETMSDILKDSVTKNADFELKANTNLNAGLIDLQKRKAKEEQEVEKLSTEQKMALASGALGNLATIFGEESKVGKAAAIAQTTIDTFGAAQASFKSLAGIKIVGPALGAIAAAAALASGFARIKQIQSIGPPVNTPSVSGPRGATSPSFNVVGTSPVNQLAETISEQTDQPVKAFVVSNEVTTAQGLERNIIEGATIG
tara:strand:+ start:2163 stop:3695 length:1533 start_codon:yes stop_codon:yes gene_type:complete